MTVGWNRDKLKTVLPTRSTPTTEISNQSNRQYKPDVAVRCGNCAYVMMFGVHITEEEFNKLSKSGVRLEYKNVGHVNPNEVIV